MPDERAEELASAVDSFRDSFQRSATEASAEQGETADLATLQGNDDAPSADDSGNDTGGQNTSEGAAALATAGPDTAPVADAEAQPPA